MNTLRALGCFALLSSVVSLAACSNAAATDPDERIGAVESALTDPTGTVDESTAPTIAGGFEAQLDLGSIMGFLQDVPGLGDLGSIGIGGLGSTGCSTGGSSTGDIDLSCSSDGAAEGKATYDVAVSAGASGASTIVTVTLDGVCEGSTCIDGSLAVKASASASGASVIIDADFDLTEGGATRHRHVGVSTSAGALGSVIDVVIFDDGGDSYVVHTAAGASGTSIEIQGDNGIFSCSYSAEGASGSCSGSASFTW